MDKALELADILENRCEEHQLNASYMLRQQQAEIEDLKNANRFIQNFAEEQHQRAVALEMRELTDEEIRKVADEVFKDYKNWHYYQIDFARAILRKASEK